MIDLVANPLRGEASVRIGKIDFRIAVTFAGLVRLSEALKTKTLDDIYIRLLGFEPLAVSCAVRCLIVADDDDKAHALCAEILADDNVSAADQDNWRQAVEQAFTSHIVAGQRRRDERDAASISADTVLGKQQSPS